MNKKIIERLEKEGKIRKQKAGFIIDRSAVDTGYRRFERSKENFKYCGKSDIFNGIYGDVEGRKSVIAF